MDEVKIRIDNIITYGLLVASNDRSKDVSKIYSRPRLESLVGTLLKEYVFEGFGQRGKEWFFYDSEHKNHQYKHWVYNNPGGTCDCGDVDAWKSDSTCSKHMEADGSEKLLPAAFLNKFRHILQYLCEILEEICTHGFSIFDNYLEGMLNSNTTPNIYHNHEINHGNSSIDANALKWCLLVPYDGSYVLDEFIDCFTSSFHMSHEDSESFSMDITECGFGCAKYLVDIDECKKAKKYIDQLWRIKYKDRTVNLRISKVHRLYIMRLAPILIGVIYEYCFDKTQLCNILSEMVFKQTKLAKVFLLNQYSLWKEVRDGMVFRIFVVSKYTKAGRINAATLFLDNIHNLYTRHLYDASEDTCSFFDVIGQIINCPSVVVYLIENGFLSKMIDVISHLLTTVGIEAGADVMQLYQKGKRKSESLLEFFKQKYYYAHVYVFP
ncbi:hypothetical protein RF11_11369 [Thelohanellus kitauei]|uniref:E3 ubiquitin-protein ligase n=1 Tax=Thelohanellus kitauei TaxID=669202 RepID=A0A0C2IGH6_THEKT|nr:hypothetical protein RF11_11369 [Thelohanellus kitauei]